MNISRFLIPLERKIKRERILPRVKGKNLKFNKLGINKNLFNWNNFRCPLKEGNKKSFIIPKMFPGLKELFLTEKEKDRENKNSCYVPLVDSNCYGKDLRSYYLKTGLKKNIKISRQDISIYGDLLYDKNDQMLNWLDLRFSFLRTRLIRFYRGSWRISNYHIRKYFGKRKSFEKVSSRDFFKKKELTHNFMDKLLLSGIPLRINSFEGRDPRIVDIPLESSVYFLKKNFFIREKNLYRDFYMEVPCLIMGREVEPSHCIVATQSRRKYFMWRKIRKKRRKLKNKKIKVFYTVKKETRFVIFSNSGNIHKFLWWDW